MAKKMATSRKGYIGTTTRIHSLISSETEVSSPENVPAPPAA